MLAASVMQCRNAIYVALKANETHAIQFIVGVASFIILTIFYIPFEIVHSTILTSETTRLSCDIPHQRDIIFLHTN